MEFKCKICAGSLTIDPKTRIATCDYCGTKQNLPMFGDDSSKILYERGNQYLLHNEYDKAEGIFNQLLSVNPNDAEIYWDLVLCKYGVTYAKDPKTGEYIPTCNRTITESVLKNENYLKAIELSPGEKISLYKKDAEIIDNIQKGILELSRKEKPFDIFISYKETDADGYRTKDSIEAQKLYDKLTELGYKVFFSRITLESKIGEEYEPIIYAALSSSKVMITVCSSSENIQSAWVKNEWSRFLVMRRGNMSKTIIPVYYDMDISELPEEFALLPAQDLKTEDFEQELIRGIKKIIPVPITKKEKLEKQKKIFTAVAAVLLLIAIPTILLIVKSVRDEKKKQEEYHLAEEQKRAEEELIKQKDQEEKERIEAEQSEKMAQYDSAMELFDAGDYDAAKAIFETMSGYEDADVMTEKCLYYEDFLPAMELYYKHEYPKAMWALQNVGDYDEVNEAIEKCERNWRESLAQIAKRLDFTGGESSGSYYINANGTVESFSYDPGDYNVELTVDSNGSVIGKKDIEANNHGKVVSIGANYPGIYALYAFCAG